MGNDFDKFLDDLDKAPTPVEEAAPIGTADTDPAPSGPPDPYAHLIGNTGPLVSQSPFDAFLEQMETEAPQDVPLPEKTSDVHDWKTVRATLYENDVDVWRCQRCFRQINCMRQETLNQCLERHKVDPNCGDMIARDVTDS